MTQVQRALLAQTSKTNLLSPLPLLDVEADPVTEPDRYTEVRSVRSVRETADSLIPSLLILVAFLLVVVTMSNPDVALMAVVAVAASVSMFSPQLMLPWTRWLAGHR